MKAKRFEVEDEMEKMNAFVKNKKIIVKHICGCNKGGIGYVVIFYMEKNK